jgi:uncharacterized repeat protein (TIGR01451 family)
MKRFDLIKFVFFVLVVCAFFANNGRIFAQTDAGTEISNFAEASYKDHLGEYYETVSPIVKLNVRAISAIIVTPDESENSEIVTVNQIFIRKFKVCNTSNIIDSYTLTQANISTPAEITALYFDADNDGEISNADILINLNDTKSPTLATGKCLNILAQIKTNNVSINQQLNININVRSTNPDSANGLVENSGTIINSVGKPAVFTNPTDPTLIPLKLVENQASYIANKNQPLNYLISFRNNGDVAANNVVVVDNLPEQLAYIANSLRVDGRSLTDAEDGDEGSVVGKRLVVRLKESVAPGQAVRINFQAMVVVNTTPAIGIVNIANISAANAQAVNTSQAVTVVDPFGTVYAARGGASSPISNARVAISTAQANENLLPIPENQGFEPNLENKNPYFTNNQGRFSFGLRPDQLGNSSQAATYFVTVSAERFRSRTLQISLSPNGNGTFKMIVRSLDGMPIAVANGFELTEKEVEIASIADVAMNIPMFENTTLELTKTADRTQVEVGDLINYQVEIHNSSVAPLFDTVIVDTLPDSFSYVADTGQIKRNGKTESITPQIVGNVLRFNIGEVTSGERFSLTYRVRVGVNVRVGESFNTASGIGRFPSGEVIQTTPVRAGVRVNAGMFSMRQFIIGRVFIDENGNQSFDKNEKPVVGARIYLANGESVITDSQGMYNLPAVSEGSQAIAIDPITIPQGYLLADNNSRSGKDWTRLLRTPLGGGAMLRQNFVLVASKENPPLSNGLPNDDNDAKNIDKKATEEIVEPKKDEVKIVKADFDKDEKKVDDANEYHPVPEGDVFLHGIVENQLIMTPAFNLEVSVTQNWKALVELNGNQISDQMIGSTREDRKNQITTYTFIGLGLKPGPNRLSVTAVSPQGILGKTTNNTIYGRGSAKRLQIVADKKELEASGRDATRVIIRAVDEWGHPAQDTSIDLQTSAGRLVKPEEYAENRQAVKDNKLVLGEGVNSTIGITSEQTNEIARQQSVQLTKGLGYVKLVSDNQTGIAELKAAFGTTTAETQVQFVPELREPILNSLAELTIGKNAPEMQNRSVNENVRGHVQLFYKGQLFGSSNMLTLAYDSQQPLNRVSGKDRLFQLNPLDRVYPIFGDSSTRFQETESNSKLYARLDRGRNYALFGDFDADMEKSRLMSYGRRLTGVKLHLENNNGDFVTVTGARPDTSFARQIIKGGSAGLTQLFYTDIMPGSELLTIEIRDRRNPEIILSREFLTRGLDYNLDTTSGTIFFLRPIPTFDKDLNLIQVVATYEYRSNGFESNVYTARASKTFNRLGLRLGFSFVNQKQTDSKPFNLGGLDLSLKLPNNGKLEAEFAMSKGAINGGFGFVGDGTNNNRNGNAFFVSLEQPIDFWQSKLRFEGAKASENFFNPFGSTITPGATRAAFSFESQPFNKTDFKVNLIEELNKTANVDNNRLTAGISWAQTVNEKIRLNFGYDLRQFTDNKNEKSVLSNLVTIGAEYKPTDKIDFSIKREQNLGDADPSYPSQTLFTANYRFTDNAKLFFTQRLSGAAITPIADVAGTGFGFSKASNETAVGVETRFGKYTSMSGRYLLENGINGTDSFAVAGLMNRLPIRKNLSLELGFERAFHLKGEGQSYNNVVLGANYLLNDSFRTSFRYELRDRNGLGQIFTLGAAGSLKPGWTVLGNYQYGNINFENRQNKITNGQLAMAIRPHDTDKYGLLFSYQRRDSFYSDGKNSPNILKSDVISADGFHQTTKRLELYGRFALKFSGDGNSNLSYGSNLTYLVQGRAQYLLSRRFDVAAENRFMYQPSSGSGRNWFGAEIGYWATPDLRFGVGYNFSRTQESFGFNNNSVFNKDGVYFVISSKMSRLFNLFGTGKKGLQSEEEQQKNSTPLTK